MTVDNSWTLHGNAAALRSGGEVFFERAYDPRAGSESGIVSRSSYDSVDLSFEARLSPATVFLAKVRQQDPFDQLTNSYHVLCSPEHDYLARHERVLQSCRVVRDRWCPITLRCAGSTITLEIDRHRVARITDRHLRHGYCFLGVKGGTALLRGIRLTEIQHNVVPYSQHGNPAVSYQVLRQCDTRCRPRVSIVTTVFDRVECLRRCLRSVCQLSFKDHEQIVVADRPTALILHSLQETIDAEANGRLSFLCLDRRHNDWGITPASVGVSVARGEYICFLSDDNGYTPEHLSNLVQVLDERPDLGFAYSSCHYNGSIILRSAPPRICEIDLGQPLFRKELFDRYLPHGLPFNEFAWDWQMIDLFIQRGVRWQHVDEPTFVFRLASYQDAMG